MSGIGTNSVTVYNSNGMPVMTFSSIGDAEAYVDANYGTLSTRL